MKTYSILIAVTNLLDLIALIVQIVGSWIMYKNSPENKVNALIFGLKNPDYETPKRKNLWFKRGFLILGFGFFIAFLSMLLKIFFPNLSVSF